MPGLLTLNIQSATLLSGGSGRCRKSPSDSPLVHAYARGSERVKREMPAIKNFGYLWDRDRVFWGKPKTPGTLLGSNRKFPEPIDFGEQKGIYLLHTGDLKVVYVGQVGAGDQGLLQRLRWHTQSGELWNRWRYFSWFGWRKVNQGGGLANYAGGAPDVKGRASEFLDEIESVIIQVVEPPLNKQGPKWKVASTLQFKQENDPRLQLSDLPAIAQGQAELSERLDRIAKRFGST
jgi:hypothetical protein